RHLRAGPDLQDRRRRRPQRGNRDDAHRALLPGRRRDADLGGERGGRSAGRRPGDGDAHLRPAVGQGSHVGRGQAGPRHVLTAPSPCSEGGYAFAAHEGGGRARGAGGRYSAAASVRRRRRSGGRRAPPSAGAASAFSASNLAFSLAMSSSRLAASLRRRRSIPPVPAGMSRPTITFSLRPSSVSTLPLTAASVSTRVVSWNEAAEMKLLVCSEALVMPSSTGLAVAGRLPAFSNARFFSLNSMRSTCSPLRKSVSPGSSTSTFCSIWRTITSMCLSLMVTPCSR